MALRAHDPFDILTATEDDCLNIDNAENVGLKIQTNMNNSMFDDISLKKKDQLKNLATLVNGVKLDDEVVHINPNVLFSRLIVQVERSESMKSYFEYELTQIPTALFKDSKMRKSDKSSLAAILKKDVPSIEQVPRAKVVCDGGALLHHVRWKCPSTYNEVV